MIAAIAVLAKSSVQSPVLAQTNSISFARTQSQIGGELVQITSKIPLANANPSNPSSKCHCIRFWICV